MADRLRAWTALDGGGFRAAWPQATSRLTVGVVEGLRVLSLRHLAQGSAAIDAVLLAHGVARMPGPGCFHGSDPWLLWVGPSECRLLATPGPVVDGVLQALAPGRDPLACALDQSDGCLAFELAAPDLNDVLSRLWDAAAIAPQAGQGTPSRFMDIGAVVMRHELDRVWILVDRGHGLYAEQWLAHAVHAAVDPEAPI